MRRRLKPVVLFAVLALVAGSCASTKDTGFPPPAAVDDGHGTAEPTPTNEGPVDLTGPIDIGDNFYEPKVARVKVGTEVVWRQISGVAPHTVTFDDGSFNEPEGCLQDQTKCTRKGTEIRYTFTEAGEVPYYCVLHGAKGGFGMAGTIVVEA